MHAIPPLEPIRRFLHKSDTAISYIRSDSVGLLQQDAHIQRGKTPCKGWTDCIWVVMGYSLETMYKVRIRFWSWKNDVLIFSAA